MTLRAAGFTMIELLVVLAILGILLATMPPGLTASLPGVRLRGAAYHLADVLRGARTQALTSRHMVTVRLEPERYGNERDAALQGLPQDTRLSLEELPPSERDAAIGRIRFFADGSATGGIIRLSQGDRHYRIGVDWLTGRVTVDG